MNSDGKHDRDITEDEWNHMVYGAQWEDKEQTVSLKERKSDERIYKNRSIGNEYWKPLWSALTPSAKDFIDLLLPGMSLLLAEIKSELFRIREPNPREHYEIPKYHKEINWERLKLLLRNLTEKIKESYGIEMNINLSVKYGDELFSLLIERLFHEIIEKTNIKPIPLGNGDYSYKDCTYEFDNQGYTDEQRLLLILQLQDEERLAKSRYGKSTLERVYPSDERACEQRKRDPIPADVKREVWRRDEGSCAECGSKEKLEYDHIIPVSKGGSNTERNIQLLCEKCNRKKAVNIQ